MDQKTAFRSMLDSRDFNVAATFHLSYKSTQTIDSIRHKLNSWNGRINRKLLGNNWLTRKDEFLVYFAFIEKLDSIPHLHLILSVPDKDLPYFTQQAQLAWIKLRGTDCGKSGVDIQRLHTEQDRQRWIRYISKDFRPDSWFYSGEFNNWDLDKMSTTTRQPGCFGFATTYNADQEICQSCDFTKPCSEAAQKALQHLKAVLSSRE